MGNFTGQDCNIMANCDNAAVLVSSGLGICVTIHIRMLNKMLVLTCYLCWGAEAGGWWEWLVGRVCLCFKQCKAIKVIVW